MQQGLVVQRLPTNREPDGILTGPTTGPTTGAAEAPGKRARSDGAAPGATALSRADRDPAQRPTASPREDWSPSSFFEAMGLNSPLDGDDGDGPAEQLTGNPRDRLDRRGAPRTEHRAPRLADASDAPAAAAQPAVVPAPASTFVKSLTSSASPLHFDSPASPDAASIYSELAAPTEGYAQIALRIGSAEQPIVEQKATPDLFIHGQPSPGDVDQNGIGDCYLMAALSSIAARDPGHLKAMMKPDGNGGATVTLWRRQAREQSLAERITSTGGGPQYVPVQITVSDELAFNVTGNVTGAGKPQRLHGAGLQAAKEPSSVDYWADVQGPTLSVHRKDLYECARWVPLLEKAYARFCEAYDQYGGAGPSGSTPNPASPSSGYEGLVGGLAYHSLRVLYGGAADQHGDLGLVGLTAFPAAGGNILAANPAAVDKLLLLAGKGERARPEHATAALLTANTDPDSQITNLATAIAAATADADYQQLPAAVQLQLAALSAALSIWKATPNDPPGTEGPKARATEAVGNLAVELARTPNHEDLAELRARLPTPIQFDEGSEDVREPDKKRLARFARWLAYEAGASLCPFELTITGRSSSDGAESKNLGVSERRAANVRDAIFASPGADAAKLARHKVVVQAAGEAGAAPGAAWRRVELEIAHDRQDNPLLAAQRAPALRAMMDLVLNVRNLGTDSSTGQRNVYASHAYSVVAVRFIDFASSELPLHKVPAEQRAQLYGLVDCEASTVKLRNPHKGNEPDRTGMGRPTRAGDGAPSGGGSDGVFTLSINEFFRNFNSLDSGVVPRTPDAP